MARFGIRLFGHARFTYDGQPFHFGASRKTLPILGYLLIHRNAAISREFLAFTMWPDVDEEVARANLRRNLTLFKTVLPPADPAESWIVTTNELVGWNPQSSYELDVSDFDRFYAESSLERAVELYEGDLLEDVYEDWVYPERERLRAAYLTSLKTLILQHRSARDFARAVGFAQRLLVVDPLREDVGRELAAIRYQSGDRAGALQGLDAFVERLRSELGVAPMPETTALREAILRGEAAEESQTSRADTAIEIRRASRPELPFTGRDAPMDRAMQLWDQAARGRGTVVFVSGEAGIGKTRLASELALRAEEQGGRILIGTTSSPEAFSYQPFVDALRAAIPLLLVSHLERVWLSVLATVIPELPGRVEIDSVAALGTEEERTRLFEALTRALRALARTRPLLLVLEDLHWCANATAELLRFVARRAASERIAIVVTYRGEEVVRTHPLRAVRRELLESGAVSIDLPRLNESAVERIVTAVQPSGISNVGDANDLYARSLGNPLFLAELIRERTERSSQMQPEGDDGVQSTIESTIAARLERLGDAGKHAAGVAAVVGDTFDLELVGEVTGWETSALLDALDQLIERHVIRETTRRGLGAYAFTHHLIRETAYAGLSADVRRRYHGLVARAIAALYETHADHWASELAKHYENAGESYAAARAWLRAANAALTVYANDDAGAAATRGLELLETSSADPATYAALLNARVEADERLANRNRQRDDIARLIELSRGQADLGALREALRRQIDFAIATGDQACAVSAVAELSKSVEPADSAWQAELRRAEARLAAERFDCETALKTGAAALAGYRACGDARGEFETLLVLIETRIRHNRYEANRSDLERATQLAHEASDPLMKARLLQSAMMEPILKQDFPTVHRLSGELLELARSTGNRLAEARAIERRANAANRMLVIGEALKGFAEAFAIYESIGERRGMRNIQNNWGTLDIAFGQVERGRGHLQRLLASAEADGDLRMCYFAFSNLGVAAQAEGDFAAAKALELRALDLARQLDSDAYAALVLGDIGAAESGLGDLEAAVADFEEAILIHRRLDQQLELHTNLARAALAYAERGKFDRARRIATDLSNEHRQHPEHFEGAAQVLWNAAQALYICGESKPARELVERAAAIQGALLDAIDLPEYRESAAGLRWYQALLEAHARAEWPGRTIPQR